MTARRVGPDYLYPDPSLTPGRADALATAELTASYACPPSIHKPVCTYSESHRRVPEAEHKKVYESYSVPEERRNRESGEVDHFFPLCAGGSNDISNLWYQPAVNPWDGRNFGYHEKDALESWVCRQVKANKLDPAAAFQRMTQDWVAYYLEVRPGKSSARVD